MRKKLFSLTTVVGLLLSLTLAIAPTPGAKAQQAGGCVRTAAEWLFSDFPPATIDAGTQVYDRLLDTRFPADSVKLRQLLRKGVFSLTNNVVDRLRADYIAAQLSVNGYGAFAQINGETLVLSPVHDWIDVSELVPFSSQTVSNHLDPAAVARLMNPPQARVKDYIDASQAILRFGGSRAEVMLATQSLSVFTGDAPFGRSERITNCTRP